MILFCKEVLQVVIVLKTKPASPVALHLTCGTLTSAGSVTIPFGTWKAEVEEWEVWNCFLELFSAMFDYCLSMEFLFSSGIFISGYFCSELGLPFGGSLRRRKDKGCHSERGRCSFPWWWSWEELVGDCTGCLEKKH